MNESPDCTIGHTYTNIPLTVAVERFTSTALRTANKVEKRNSITVPKRDIALKDLRESCKCGCPRQLPQSASPMTDRSQIKEMSDVYM
jgi:hypothetical protein